MLENVASVLQDSRRFEAEGELGKFHMKLDLCKCTSAKHPGKLFMSSSKLARNE